MNLIVDLHTHTMASGHAYSTLKENIEEAARKGLAVLGTSDHSPGMPGSSPAFFFNNYKVIKRELMGVKILRGIEANIIDFDGRVDVDDSLAGKTDYVIASLHSHCIESGTEEENTRACIEAMKHPFVRILGHPDDGRYPVDYRRLARAAAEWGVALELNNSSLQPESSRLDGKANARTMLEWAKRTGTRVIVGSDSHIYCDVGRFGDALSLLEDVAFPEDLVVNTSMEKLDALLRRDGQEQILE